MACLFVKHCTYGPSDGGGRRPGTDRKAVLQRWHDHSRRRRHSVKNRLVPPRPPASHRTERADINSKRLLARGLFADIMHGCPFPTNAVWTRRNFGSAALFIFPVRRSDKPGSCRNLRRREASFSVLPSVALTIKVLSCDRRRRHRSTLVLLFCRVVQRVILLFAFGTCTLALYLLFPLFLFVCSSRLARPLFHAIHPKYRLNQGQSLAVPPCLPPCL